MKKESSQSIIHESYISIIMEVFMEYIPLTVGNKLSRNLAAGGVLRVDHLHTGYPCRGTRAPVTHPSKQNRV